VESVERNAILRALRSSGWNVTRSAELLGLSRKGLQLKLREYDLRRPEN
jgi:transcriptional regulator of acetoin/glycerol metabolism